MAINFRDSYYVNLAHGEHKSKYRVAKLQYNLALRFGLVVGNKFDININNAVVEDIETNRDNKAFRATMEVNGSSYENVIVIASPKKTGGYNIVTMWYASDAFPESDKGGAHIFAECVSKGLRVCSLKEVAEHSVAYRNGTKGSAEIFQDWAKEQGRVELSKDFQLLIEEEKRRYAGLKGELEAAIKKSTEQQAQIIDMGVELARLKFELNAAHQDKGQKVSIASAGKLVAVLENVAFGKGLCTVLKFENGSQKHMRVDMFDQTGVVTARAKNLVGQEVLTTCWDLPGSTKWKDMGYFRDVYPVGVVK